MSYDDEPRSVRVAGDEVVPAARGFSMIREFDESHAIVRDPVIAWRVARSGHGRPLPVTLYRAHRYIAIEYPDGRVLSLVGIGHPKERPEGTEFADVDVWLAVVQEYWTEFGAP